MNPRHPAPLGIATPLEARPWYRGLCNLDMVLKFWEKPHSAAFHLVLGEWNLADWVFAWCPESVEPLLNKLIHFAYVYSVCLLGIFLGYLLSKLPTLKQVREWSVKIFWSSAPNNEV